MPQAVDIEKLKSHYGTLARRYDRRWQRFNETIYHWVISRMDSPENILDAGCGTGRFLMMATRHFPAAKLTGVDGTPAMLEIARNRLPQAAFHTADLEKMEAGDTQYDCVCSLNILHHLNDPRRHLRLLRDLCAPGGTVFLCDFAIETWPLRFAEKYWRSFHPAHHKAFTGDELRDMISPCFNIARHEILRPDPFWRLQVYKLRHIL